LPCSSQQLNSQRGHNAACSLQNYVSDTHRFLGRIFAHGGTARVQFGLNPSTAKLISASVGAIGSSEVFFVLDHSIQGYLSVHWCHYDARLTESRRSRIVAGCRRNGYSALSYKRRIPLESNLSSFASRNAPKNELVGSTSTA
jgi:hypothetical protein